MKEMELTVSGMECSGCENRIKNALLEMKQIKEVSASHETGKVKVTFQEEPTEEMLENVITAIERLDFEVEK